MTSWVREPWAWGRASENRTEGNERANEDEDDKGAEASEEDEEE